MSVQEKKKINSDKLIYESSSAKEGTRQRSKGRQNALDLSPSFKASSQASI
jgi:hypothetical protein